ncbi:MAG: aldolase/citrate lyase family protein, partial [Gaiellales bacterium]
MRAPLITMMFVPGSEGRKLDKIPSLAPDAFIIDLEDAVALAAKPSARPAVAAALLRHGALAQLWVRVNAVETGLLYDDVLAVVEPGLAGIVLPKTRSAADVALLDGLLTVLEHERDLRRGSVELMPGIETAAALEHAVEIGSASPRVRCLGFGAGDFSLDLGLEWPPPSGRLSPTLVNAKAELVLASRRAGLEAPHDGVFPDFKDLEALRCEAEEARALGFGGKHAIHPAQLPVIAEVFAPSEAELQRDRDIVEAFDESEGRGVAAIHIDGRFIDYPVAERARRRLAQAGESANGGGSAPPLRDIRVLDLSSLYAAPLISTNLGDFGADVVKVEHPRGDDARRWGLSKDGVPLWWKV